MTSQHLDFEKLLNDLGVRQYARSGLGVLLMGSFANGSATDYSDVDLVITFPRAPAEERQRMMRSHGRLVVIKLQSRATLLDSIENPLGICRGLWGVKGARLLIDDDGFLVQLQERARKFEWTAELLLAARCLSIEELIGWLEEVHKGMAGIARGDSGRMLQAIHGCSWGMLRVIQLNLTVLERSDNTVVDDVCAALGPESTLPTLLRGALGLGHAELTHRCLLGLQLFCGVTDLVRPGMSKSDLDLVEPTYLQATEFLSDHQPRQERASRRREA